MAAAAAQLQAMQQAQTQEPFKKHGHILFGDLPTETGRIHLKNIENNLAAISRGQASLLSNVNGTDPGFGGNGNAVVLAQHFDRNEASFHYLLSCMDPASQLHKTCSAAPFTTGAHIWTYIHGPEVVYLPPSLDAAKAHKKRVKAFTHDQLPTDKQDSMQVLHFKSMVTSHNPLCHPQFDFTRDEITDIFLDGLHPKAKLIGIKVYRDRANLNLNFPAVYAGHEVNAGAVHPLAGECNIDALALYIHKEFNDLISAGELRLKGVPMINAVSESSDVPTDTTNTIFISWEEVPHGFNLEQHVLATFQRKSGKLRTCKRCGGVNHFEFGSDGKNCPTPEGSVDSRLLSQIRYPIDINPWKFSNGRGRGGSKGGSYKGGGKGSSYGKGGRGNGRSGAFSATEYWHQDADGNWIDITEQYSTQQPPNVTPPAVTPPVESPPAVQVVIVEDYDGWNN